MQSGEENKPILDITPTDERVATIPNSSNLPSTFDNVPSNFEAQLAFFTEIAKDSNTGVNSPAMALMLFNKAKELGIGWANAVSHMSLIKGKLGIDIHIVKAIISKPGSGIQVEKTEDYKPIFQFTDNTFTKTWTSDNLPSDAQIVSNFNTPVLSGKFPVIIIPRLETDSKGNVVAEHIEPIDWRTTYRFTRKKKDIDGSFITEVKTSSFSWSEALAAKLPFDKQGVVNTDSNWMKYRKLMIDHRAYTFGARDIASDLLLGCYERTELYEMNGMQFNINED